MRVIACRWTVLVAVLLWAGCDQPMSAPNAPPTPSAQPAPPPPPPPLLRAEHDAAASQAPSASARPAAAPSASAPPASTPPAEPAPIRLSAGVALAQTGPEGTMMGFSVDYRFVQGQPDPSRKYFWVIHVGGKPALKSQVALQARGNLADFVQGLRPENGPFACHIEDDTARRVSDIEAMR